MDFAIDVSELELAFAQASGNDEIVMLAEQQPTTPISECRW